MPGRSRPWVSIADAREEARRRLPRMIFDFIDGGAGEETTLRRNRDAFHSVRLLPRVLVDVREPTLATTVLGTRLDFPVVCGPTGMPALTHPGAEVAAASAAFSLGTTFTVGTTSSISIGEVAARCGRAPWFQLYAWRDRSITIDLLDQARDAGVDVLLLTVDTPVAGVRERDLRNGMTIPPRASLAIAADLVRHPRWAWGFLRGPGTRLGTLSALELAASTGALGIGGWFSHLFNPGLSWDDVAWIRQSWPGHLAVKGILRPEDAVMARAAGADAIVVSNHGGRQLEGAPATLDVLPDVAAALANSSTEILLDSGVRTGSDVAAAIAAGADAVLVGRPWLYGLGARGRAGVEEVLTILRDQLTTTLQLLGCTDLGALRQVASCTSPAPGGGPDPIT